jgi:hypothetical protein
MNFLEVKVSRLFAPVTIGSISLKHRLRAEPSEVTRTFLDIANSKPKSNSTSNSRFVGMNSWQACNNPKRTRMTAAHALYRIDALAA